MIPSVFEYNDFRAYMRDAFAARKQTTRSFSHRWLARRLGLASPNHVLLVMQGKRSLTGAIRLRLSEVLAHSERERTYFEHMVTFAQARSDSERTIAFRRMAALRGGGAHAPVDEQQYEYYANWYNPAVRELVHDAPSDLDPNLLAKELLPAISPAQVRGSIDLLLRLGLIREVRSKFRQASRTIATSDQVSSLAIRNFHRRMGMLAVESLDRTPRGERNITSCTLTLSREAYATVLSRTDAFRQELLTIAEADKTRGRVYHFNLQLFPVAREGDVGSRKD